MINAKNVRINRATLKKKIDTYKETIISLINSDKNIVKYTSPGFKETILMNAAAGGHESTCEALLKSRGTDINTQDIDGKTALMHAVRKNQHGAIELLLNRGSDITIKNNNKKTALDIAIEKLERYLNNEPSVDENINLFEKSPNIKATEKTIELLKTARMYLYIRVASWFLAAVLLVTLTGVGIHHYILEPRANA